MSRECLIDFLDIRLSDNCEISTDGVSDDYYTLENLIAADLSKRNLGFMAFSVSKPPLEITIKFKWKIDLKLIKVSRALSLIDIFAHEHCVQVYAELLSLKSTKFQVLIKCLDFEGNEILRKIGDLALADDQIGFCLKAGGVNHPVEDNLRVEEIYPYARKSIHGVDFLKIVIQDTKMRRAPVLKKIEVWGFPSKKNQKGEVQSIFRLLEPTRVALEETPISGEKPDQDPVEFIIPEEFLDAITNELLAMPFILPSGNIIDESSIERHNRHEENYGRLPSDPFTGLIYSSDSQPKFNESLKVRLDQFKLRNSHELDVKKSGRTVGSREEPKPTTSGYSAAGHISKKIKLNGSSASDIDSLISSIYESNQVSIFTKPRATRTEPSNECLACKTQTSPFYQITRCSHEFCKPCLLQLGTVCGVCNITFDSRDVQKKNL
jgi:Family of unknown function (DUF5918)/U-box domain